MLRSLISMIAIAAAIFAGLAVAGPWLADKIQGSDVPPVISEAADGQPSEQTMFPAPCSWETLAVYHDETIYTAIAFDVHDANTLIVTYYPDDTHNPQLPAIQTPIPESIYAHTGAAYLLKLWGTIPPDHETTAPVTDYLSRLYNQRDPAHVRFLLAANPAGPAPEAVVIHPDDPAVTLNTFLVRQGILASAAIDDQLDRVASLCFNAMQRISQTTPATPTTVPADPPDSSTHTPPDPPADTHSDNAGPEDTHQIPAATTPHPTPTATTPLTDTPAPPGQPQFVPGQ